MRAPSALRARLLSWFEENGRDLPWRRTRDPYAIWLSEVMLQQTRVAAVIEYYRRFLDRFPTVDRLAGASEDEVLALWSGLGYYRRARMMHAAAKQIVKQGRFPGCAEEWRLLPGIGRYTAAAIASITRGEAIAVVDGNVERVLARLSGQELDVAAAWEAAQRLLHPRFPGQFNQAMMELGATVCTPRAPVCGECPLRRWCVTRGEHPRKKPSPRKRAHLRFALHRRHKRFLLVQRRRSERLMAGMWELPAAQPPLGEMLARVRHSITNTDYVITLHEAENGTGPAGKWFTGQSAEEYPLTGVTRKLLKHVGLLRHPNRVTG